MANLQPLLVGGNGAVTDLQLVVSENSDSILVFLGTAVLERIRCSREALEYKMLVGRLVNAGWSLSRLQAAFGHDPRTMKRWAAALLSEDVEFAVRAFGGRGSTRKLTPPMVRYIKRRYGELRGTVRGYRVLIEAEVADLFGTRVSGETLRKVFREADRESSETGDGPSGGPARAPGMATRCASGPASGSDAWTTHNQSPDPPRGPLPVFRTDGPTCRMLAVHHAGMVLFALALDLFCRRRPWAVGRQTQWVGQVLQGAVNLEQSRLITPDDLARFTGPVLAGIEAQRTALDRIAGQEAVVDIYAANARLIPDGPGRDRVFYYDPHSKHYTGKQNVLKGWCGSRHAVTKVLNVDMIHSRSGRPCFAQHYSAYYDLRVRFFMTLTQFDRLFPARERRGRLFVLDRGIYGLEAFARFGEDDVLTWEKGYSGGGWNGREPQVVFVRTRTRNGPGSLKLYRFECREEPWRREPGMRRILVRATNPAHRTIEVSILCSDPDLPIEEAVWLMFRRWVQENDFKYLDRHFGLNQLTSYASKPVAEVAGQLRDMPVDSPEYRELKTLQRAAENALATHLLKRERVRDRIADTEGRIAELARVSQRLHADMRACLKQLPRARGRTRIRVCRRADQLLQAARQHRRERRKARRTLEGQQEKLGQIQTGIPPLKRQLEQLERRLYEAVRQQSRLRLLIDNHYRLLDTRRKETMDALRITASNMFAGLVTVFRPIYRNYRNDHVMLRNLTRADGFIRCADGTLEVRLWLKGRFQPWQIRAFSAFLAEMTERINARLQPGEPTLRIALANGRPTL